MYKYKPEAQTFSAIYEILIGHRKPTHHVISQEDNRFIDMDMQIDISAFTQETINTLMNTTSNKAYSLPHNLQNNPEGLNPKPTLPTKPKKGLGKSRKKKLTLEQ